MAEKLSRLRVKDVRRDGRHEERCLLMVEMSTADREWLENIPGDLYIRIEKVDGMGLTELTFDAAGRGEGGQGPDRGVAMSHEDRARKRRRKRASDAQADKIRCPTCGAPPGSDCGQPGQYCDARRDAGVNP